MLNNTQSHHCEICGKPNTSQNITVNSCFGKKQICLECWNDTNILNAADADINPCCKIVDLWEYSPPASSSEWDEVTRTSEFFLWDDHTLFGIELETDVHDHRVNNVREYSRLEANYQNICSELERYTPAGKTRQYRDSIFFFTDDQSLSRVGIEIISAPADLNYHMTVVPWNKVMSLLKKYGYTPENSNSSCGYHIHVSREGFNDPQGDLTAECPVCGHDTFLRRGVYKLECANCDYTFLRGDDTDTMRAIGGLIWFFYKHQDDLLRITRREPAMLDKWARFITVSNEMSLVDMYYHATQVCDKPRSDDLRNGRYHATNLQGGKTVEIRIFKGTSVTSILLGHLLMVDSITACIRDSIRTNNYSDSEIKRLTWNDIVENSKERYGNKTVDVGGRTVLWSDLLRTHIFGGASRQ